MGFGAQAAIEFLTTYGIAFLIISIVMVTMFAIFYVPRNSIPSQCDFYGGLRCEDALYYPTAGGSTVNVIGVDVQPGIINISGFSASVAHVGSVAGSCTPTRLTMGQTTQCTANFISAAKNGTLYDGTMSVSADYCAPAPAYVSNSPCPQSSAYSFGGSFRTQAGT